MPRSFEEINSYFESMFGFSLFLREEPYLMLKKRRSHQWVGANDGTVTLLKRNGKPTTKYPKSYGIIVNGGHRPISMNTLLSNIKEGRPLYTKV